MSNRIVTLTAYAFALLFSFVCIYPFLNILAISLNDGLDAQRGGIYFFPRRLSFENYHSVLTNPRLFQALWVTLFRVIVGTAVSVVLNATFAYALSKKYVRGRKLFNWIVVIPMFFGGGIIPTFLVLHQLHLTNNLLTYVVPSLYGSFYIVLMRSFFVSLPESLEEAARIDGAGDLRIFYQVAMPLSAPVLAAVTLFIGVWNWNDWYVGTAYIFKPGLWTLQNLLLSIIQSADVTSFKDVTAMLTMARKAKVTVESLKMAMIVVTALPIVTIYPFLQRHFVAGVMIGSLKE